MTDTDKYQGLIDAEGYIDYDGLDHLLSEVNRLSDELKRANQLLRDIRDGRLADKVWLHITGHLGGD